MANYRWFIPCTVFGWTENSTVIHIPTQVTSLLSRSYESYEVFSEDVWVERQHLGEPTGIKGWLKVDLFLLGDCDSTVSFRRRLPTPLGILEYETVMSN